MPVSATASSIPSRPLATLRARSLTSCPFRILYPNVMVMQAG
jgi:hypothetical protein